MKTVYIERLKLFAPISMIMLNNINEIDADFMEDNFDLFFTDCGACGGSGERDGKTCEECNGEGQFDREYYQFFLTDAGEYDVERLKSFGVDVGYSKKLEHYIICIGDFGTSWSAFSYSKKVPDDYELYPNETLTRTTVY